MMIENLIHLSEVRGPYVRAFVDGLQAFVCGFLPGDCPYHRPPRTRPSDLTEKQLWALNSAHENKHRGLHWNLLGKYGAPTVDSLHRRGLLKNGIITHQGELTWASQAEKENTRKVKRPRAWRRAWISGWRAGRTHYRDQLAKGHPAMKFQVGDWVKWTSQSNGHAKNKHGRVVAIVPKDTMLHQAIPNGFACRSRGSMNSSRNHISFLVRVGRSTQLYWPLVSKLSAGAITK